MTAPDQRFYDIVADEIRSRVVVDGVWVRSFSEAAGDETKARAIYIAYRVDQLKAEESASRLEAAKCAQARARREQAERERVLHEARQRRTDDLEASRQHPLEPGAKKLIIVLILIASLLFFVFVLPLLTK
jgi:uncharacterized membrane protein YdbT with pleckstrin-like domain